MRSIRHWLEISRRWEPFCAELGGRYVAQPWWRLWEPERIEIPHRRWTIGLVALSKSQQNDFRSDRNYQTLSGAVVDPMPTGEFMVMRHAARLLRPLSAFLFARLGWREVKCDALPRDCTAMVPSDGAADAVRRVVSLPRVGRFLDAQAACSLAAAGPRHAPLLLRWLNPRRRMHVSPWAGLAVGIPRFMADVETLKQLADVTRELLDACSQDGMLHDICVACGYLRATPDRCPECGTPRPAGQTDSPPPSSSPAAEVEAPESLPRRS